VLFLEFCANNITFSTTVDKDTGWESANVAIKCEQLPLSLSQGK